MINCGKLDVMAHLFHCCVEREAHTHAGGDRKKISRASCCREIDKPESTCAPGDARKLAS